MLYISFDINMLIPSFFHMQVIATVARMFNAKQSIPRCTHYFDPSFEVLYFSIITIVYILVDFCLSSCTCR